MKYNTPNMEIMQLDVNNIIVTSFGDGNGEVGTPNGETVIRPGDSVGDNWD